MADCNSGHCRPEELLLYAGANSTLRAWKGAKDGDGQQVNHKVVVLAGFA